MLLEEFVERTGFKPTISEYREIEEAYYTFDGDKNEFCKAFDVQNAIAKRGQKLEEAERRIHELEKGRDERLAEARSQIKRLQDELEKEQEWEPAAKQRTCCPQGEYSDLLKNGKVLSEEEAKRLIHEEFGFAIDHIKIIKEVYLQEVNRHRRTRISKTLERDPVYAATDWYYIRFNVLCAAGTHFWEAYNGNLEAY